MLQREIESWPDFQEAVGDLLSGGLGSSQRPGHSALLFRGQADAEWSLQTTLERVEGVGVRLWGYHQIALAALHEIESYTANRWDVPSFEDFEVLLCEEHRNDYPLDQGLYEYLVYLRHHSFPSPLLDWTISPYVAAYFAFRTAEPDKRVAIFAFQEYTGEGKGGIVGAPKIQGLGRYVRAHPRHYLQQSEYTVAWAGENTKMAYCPHEDAFSEHDRDEQDLLWKFTLPGQIKRDVLRYLHLHNITAHSLLSSDEALMESLAIRHFVLKN